MTLETLFNLDPRVWPTAIMAMLRVVTVFFFLPIFGDSVVPTRVRIGLAIVFTFLLWPVIETGRVSMSQGFLQWSPLTLALASLREVFFGFATGFAARMLTFAASIAAGLAGVNMGFQTASLFSPGLDTQESSYAVFKGWLVVVCLLSFNAHHLFLSGLAESFQTVPLAPAVDAQGLLRSTVGTARTCLVLGLRLAAPLLVVQILVTLSLGLLNRALPSLNVLVINFPLSFLASFVVLFLSLATLVRLLGGLGLQEEARLMTETRASFKTHAPSTDGRR